ncbi:hypothetical protein LIER_19882 [Lithospermum erythrorhizon]|uniref:Reverse transcriptase n=1 Tax=Lithospermum erythrorhizon TaxID=34254 RepID=A0AAV3QLY9_LITER
MQYHSGCKVSIPCLAFVDDCIIFSNGAKLSINRVMKFLEHYQKISGQAINKEKSTCIMPPKLTASRVNLLFHATAKNREGAEENIHWLLGKGECDFWLDSWMDTGPLSNDIEVHQKGTEVKDFLTNGQ